MSRRRSRMILTAAVAVAIGAFLSWAFWPRPMMVDIGEVTTERMTVTIDEEGRTRVHDPYVVSTPVAGHLLRVDVEPGDAVVRGDSVVAQMLPTPPTALDVRTREQAQANVDAAEAALRLAHAELNRAIADKDLADANLGRTRELREGVAVSQAELDRAVREARAAEAELETAEATIAMRQAELANAQAALISFGDGGGAAGSGSVGEVIPIIAPTTGRVLHIIQQSETILPAGAPILEIGNIDSDLEVLVELLSTDAVQVSPGDRVLIEDWGGPGALSAVVERVEPWGFTEFSALGVEEQRVNTIISFTDPQSRPRDLGHGFRVEARI
ncbi:HlyD family efflux transporter periplasmic adaptor subunit, partial [Candidatus Sumerlaeota bacterium]|nr:HlyD family efflux transporter periplasmic adaptor subunit [Candidatus Sumerlaeota bacterium]